MSNGHLSVIQPPRHVISYISVLIYLTYILLRLKFLRDIIIKFSNVLLHFTNLQRLQDSIFFFTYETLKSDKKLKWKE